MRKLLGTTRAACLIWVSSRGECAARWIFWWKCQLASPMVSSPDRAVTSAASLRSSLEFFGLDPLGRPRRGLPGQHPEDGEAVHDVLGADADHGHAAAGCDFDQSFEGQLQQGLAHRGPAGGELLGDGVEVDPGPAGRAPVRMRSLSSRAARSRTVPAMSIPDEEATQALYQTTHLTFEI